MGGTMLSTSLIQFSINGWGCVPSLLFGLRPNYGRGNGGNASLLQKTFDWAVVFSSPTLQQATAEPRLCWRLLNSHRQVWFSLLWGHCSFLLGCTGFVCVLQESVSPVLCKFCNQIPLASKVKLPGSQSLCQIPRLGNLQWVLELS